MRNERMNGRKQVRQAEAGRTAPHRPATLQPVWFEYFNDAAREVTIAGSFNRWDMSNMRMVRLTGGRWLRVMFLPPGRFEYLFVVDGRCVADPRATESVPNVFGCVNSVVSVPARTSRNGCVGRATSRKQVSSGRPSLKSGRRPCREVNARRSAAESRAVTIS